MVVTSLYIKSLLLLDISVATNVLSFIEKPNFKCLYCQHFIYDIVDIYYCRAEYRLRV